VTAGQTKSRKGVMSVKWKWVGRSIIPGILTITGIVQFGGQIVGAIRWLTDAQAATIVNLVLVVSGISLLLFVNWPRKAPPVSTESNTEYSKDFAKLDSYFESIGECIANLKKDLQNPPSKPPKLTDLYAPNPSGTPEVDFDQILNTFEANVHGTIVSTIGRAEGNAFQKFCADIKDRTFPVRLAAITSYINGLEKRSLAALRQKTICKSS